MLRCVDLVRRRRPCAESERDDYIGFASASFPHTLWPDRGRVRARRWGLVNLPKSRLFSLDAKTDKAAMARGRQGADVLVPECLQRGSEPEWLPASVVGWLAASLRALKRQKRHSDIQHHAIRVSGA